MTNDIQTTTVRVDDLCCAEEEQLIGKKLKVVPGVHDVRCNLISRTVRIQHTCPKEAITQGLHEIGFACYPASAPAGHGSFWDQHGYFLFTALSGILLFVGIILDRVEVDRNVVLSVFATSIISGGWRIAIKGWRAGTHFALDMNFLMVIATVGAAALGKWEEGAAVIFLFSLSQLLERYSMDRSRKAIRSVMDLSPPMAMVKRGEAEQSIRAEEVLVGDHIVIRPGERIPLDGHVVAGSSNVNQAPITGESTPVQKQVHDVVYAGSLNERGTLEVEVHNLYTDSTLAKIVHMVEVAQEQRAPIQQFAERFARYYTPAVIAVAILLAVAAPLVFPGTFSWWLYRALVLLVIACPCALVISTPVTILSGLSNAARHGILIKGGRYLEELGRVRTIAFDKTGTLTKGIARVTDVIPLNSFSKERIIQLAASLEQHSEHPIADAVLRKAGEDTSSVERIHSHQFEALVGRGIQATIDGIRYVLGNHSLVEARKICSPDVENLLDRLEAEGKTTIILGTDREALGVIAMSDELREESRQVISTLRAQGISRTIMLTGDNEETARSIAELAGIDEFHAGMLPEDKVNRIKVLKERYGSVAMVGDGINDAPALAASTVGIAMGKSGTDIALETADVVLMSDDLTKLPYAVALSKRTLAIIRQNIIISLCTKLLFLILGVAGVATLWMAVLADDGATLAVLLNGLRALRTSRQST